MHNITSTGASAARDGPSWSEAAERDPRVARSRALLIDAAAGLLAEGGVEAVTIDAVTSASGVSRATLYRHFATGAELVAAAFERLIPPVTPAPESGTLRDRLLSLMTRQAELIQHAPLHATLLSWLGLGAHPEHEQHHSDRPRLRQLRDRIIEHYRKPFDTVLADAADQNELDDIDPDIAIAQLAGPLIFNRLVTQQPSDQHFCSRIVDDFLAAHRPNSADHQPCGPPGTPRSSKAHRAR
ncbi:TetR/AcrR family transcriptional regulator [Haloechinothrix sp. YIM 98757]|uniref:TetR/AcrR family transcriptional regulator n=1 Tax=Haloechinothrix aidingensis TaxID=2752311 RepID=A0A838A8C5_9PSEU|nr:TetR/AcrR family transcriptional regulator [Haloechinothrix aidingensis]MBA0124679.1 TetR/AcrR family transcriptional regulator [Haloechinothrix aidingensis]